MSDAATGPDDKKPGDGSLGGVGDNTQSDHFNAPAPNPPNPQEVAAAAKRKEEEERLNQELLQNKAMQSRLAEQIQHNAQQELKPQSQNTNLDMGKLADDVTNHFKKLRNNPQPSPSAPILDLKDSDLFKQMQKYGNAPKPGTKKYSKLDDLYNKERMVELQNRKQIIQDRIAELFRQDAATRDAITAMGNVEANAENAEASDEKQVEQRQAEDQAAAAEHAASPSPGGEEEENAAERDNKFQDALDEVNAKREEGEDLPEFAQVANDSKLERRDTLNTHAKSTPATNNESVARSTMARFKPKGAAG